VGQVSRRSPRPEVLDRIAFSVETHALAVALGMDGKPDLEAELRGLVAEAATIGRPRAVYREVLIGWSTDNQTELDGVVFESRVLAGHLRRADKAFPFVATCGVELASWAESQRDTLMRYGAEKISELAARAALRAVAERVDAVYGLSQAAVMNPGSLPDWPVDQQSPLFRLLGDVQGLIGVSLTESFMMRPIKSVSGIRFAVDKAFESCELCDREVCEERKAPYQGIENRRYG